MREALDVKFVENNLQDRDQLITHSIKFSVTSLTICSKKERKTAIEVDVRKRELCALPVFC